MNYKIKLEDIQQKLRQPLTATELRSACLELLTVLLERESEEYAMEREMQRINSGEWRTGRIDVDKPNTENIEKTEGKKEQGKPQKTFEELL